MLKSRDVEMDIYSGTNGKLTLLCQFEEKEVKTWY